MTDLPTLERYLLLIIDRIPKDGSTVDLQPLFFNLVSSRDSSGVKKDHLLNLLLVPPHRNPVSLRRVF